MLYDYLIQNYTDGEPIFLYELPGTSPAAIRQEMKRLTDEGKVERVQNGVYFLAYTTILGTQGRMSPERYVEKKYLNANGEVSGYITGLQFVNACGLTTQNPAIGEICSNQATTKQRRIEIVGRKFFVYKPVAKITAENKNTLQFLDLMTNVDRYSELQGEDLQQKLRKIVKRMGIDFNQIREYITLFPDKVFRNLYQGGLINELVS